MLGHASLFSPVTVTQRRRLKSCAGPIPAAAKARLMPTMDDGPLLSRVRLTEKLGALIISARRLRGLHAVPRCGTIQASV